MANLEQLSADMPPEERIEPSPSDGRAPAAVEPSLSRNLSSSRLNAQAPEFVPRSPVASHAPALGEARMVQIHHAPPPPPVMHIFHPPPPPSRPRILRRRWGGYRENETVRAPVDPDPAPVPASVARDGLSDDVIQRVTKQVEYYFSDANLATTEHLMRFINKDPEGFVPISVIGAFKKIKALINNNAQLATALRTSSKLVVSDDGKKVRRQQQITEANLEELQSRIVVAENLPEDHCYQNLLKLFSVLHAFVEFELFETLKTELSTRTTFPPTFLSPAGVCLRLISRRLRTYRCQAAAGPRSRTAQGIHHGRGRPSDADAAAHSSCRIIDALTTTAKGPPQTRKVRTGGGGGRSESRRRSWLCRAAGARRRPREGEVGSSGATTTPATT
ncbi:unnamed protein product [Spirodela intermedia]|uniref:HTH La-type RNA-binding domain-containing protein n=1 Tax=Spirodela intermedia TaxID=51605 RepID=A0A7I8IQY4_SPIIN|nr:unnamed protein product [Spirodela intermedia]CAA6660271.1 unnamed protein product [Spirodela intermedia]